MGAEKLHNPATPQRTDDKHMGRGRTGLEGCFSHATLKFFQSPGQMERIPVDFGPFPVGQIFSGPGNGHLNEHGGNGSDDHHGNNCDGVLSFFIIAAPEYHGPLGHVG